MPLAMGETFAGYTVIRMLGSGGMGEVYLVQHPRLPRQDALKVLASDISGDATFRERFNREADLAATLWHPHIVGVHDRGEHNGQLWIAMDFVDGTDAGHLLVNRYPGGMPVDDVAEILTAVAGALDYAHRQGLLHRDVKPANIMVTEVDDAGEHRTLLGDFGIARPMEDTLGLTDTNMTVGTVAYSAPEQLMGEQIDGRADQYALAAAAYQLLTGSRLFPHTNQAVVISRHLNASPPTLRDTRPELAALDLVLARALSKHPDERFERCADFARAFTQAALPLHGGAAAATVAAPTPPKTSTEAAAAAPTIEAASEELGPPARAEKLLAPPIPADRRNQRLLWGVAVAAVLVVASVIVVWRPWDSSRPAVPPPASSSPAAPTVTAPMPSMTRSAAPPAPLPSPTRDIAGMVVMLDPGLSGGAAAEASRQVPSGRGGNTDCETAGATTANGYPEHAFNWDITLRVRQALTHMGVRSAMTRGNDDTAGPCGPQRAEMANGLPVHPDAIVSIQAYSGPPSEQGFTVVYSSPPLNDAQARPADQLSHVMRDALAAAPIPFANGVDGLDGRGNVPLLNLARYPAVQVELANVNNTEDVFQMQSPDGRARYAEAVTKGIAAYLSAQPS